MKGPSLFENSIGDKRQVFRQEVTKIEIDTLFVFYSLSDQYGKVDIPSARKYIFENYGVTIPDGPFTLTLKHYDTLMDAGIIPDTRAAIAKALNPPQRRPKRKAPNQSKSVD